MTPLQRRVDVANAGRLRLDRLYSDGAGDQVELAVSYFDPEHYSYRVKLRRTPG